MRPTPHSPLLSLAVCFLCCSAAQLLNAQMDPPWNRTSSTPFSKVLKATVDSRWQVERTDLDGSSTAAGHKTNGINDPTLRSIILLVSATNHLVVNTFVLNMRIKERDTHQQVLCPEVFNPCLTDEGWLKNTLLSVLRWWLNMFSEAIFLWNVLILSWSQCSVHFQRENDG